MKTIFVTDNREPATVELAAFLASKGFRVLLNDLAGTGVPDCCEAVRADPADCGALESLLEGVSGELAGVLHPAPPFRWASVEDADEALWTQAFQEGALASLNVTRLFGERLASQGGGALVYLGSIHAEKPSGSAFLSTISCSATQMLCREAALDYGSRGVNCFHVQRGVMEQDLQNKNRHSNLYCAPERQYPSGKLPETKELFGLMELLFSGQASILNGADLRADGGMSMYYGEQLADEELAAIAEQLKRIPAPALPEFHHPDDRLSSPRGRVALITGGGKGVGAGVARVLCAAGYQACIGWNSSEALAKATLEEIQSTGGEAFLFRADVSDREQLRAMAQETARRYGGIDVLVNNAALQPNRYIRQYDAETFHRVWDINIGGYWRALQECLPYLRQSGCPRVVNISSIHGNRPTVFDPGYAMTKGAIRMFTREAALELGQYGVTVNAINLGGCKIEGKTGNFVFGLRKKPGTCVNPYSPLRRECYPEDAGFLALYLASEESKNMTGSAIRLDSGSLLV